MNLTEEQKQILLAVPVELSAGRSVIIDAKAGSGKTFILSEVAPDLPRGGRCLAFNKAIAVELERRLPSHCPASTFHSLGFAILRDRLTKPKSDPSKNTTHAKKMGIRGQIRPYSDLVSAMKTNGLGLVNCPPLSEEMAIKIIDTRGIDIPEGMTPSSFAIQAIKLMQSTLRDLKTIDFDDMLYLPLFLKQKYSWAYDQYPYLLIDEAQDVSPLRLELIKALTSTVLAVGDPYQSIYGFAGSMGGALSEIRTEFECSTYPLTITFRCPPAICTEASEIIQPAEIFPSTHLTHKGEVSRQTLPSGWYPTSPSQAVLCRMNAPLFVLALQMLRAGQPLDFRSDFPRQLIAFMKKFKAKTCKELQVRVTAWFEEEHERLSSKKMRAALSIAKEKHDTIMYLATQHEDVKGIELTLDTLLIPQDGAPTLSTVHKAKGLEWKNVYLLRPDLIPAPFASSPEDLEQENNLLYVAVTRAIDTFTYLDPRS